MSIITQRIKLRTSRNYILDIRREDLIHPLVSGNKYRKLKYNILEAKRQGKTSLLTFGGAFSNHIAATAYAGSLHGLKTIGVIRGEELESKVEENPTLNMAMSQGMKFVFISRQAYREKESDTFLKALKEEFKDSHILPEGGTNRLAIEGCQEILQKADSIYDYICTSVGTGGTLAGLINSAEPNQKLIGFSSLNALGLTEDISKFVRSNNWELNFNYHFGGYAKINEELIAFINAFKSEFDVPLDPIYTGKMMFGIMDLITSNYFPDGSKILAIHTGGLQGIKGMNQRLKRQNKPQINV